MLELTRRLLDRIIPRLASVRVLISDRELVSGYLDVLGRSTECKIRPALLRSVFPSHQPIEYSESIIVE